MSLILSEFRVWTPAMFLSLRRYKVLFKFFGLERWWDFWNASNWCGKIIRQLSLDVTLAHAPLQYLRGFEVFEQLSIRFFLFLPGSWIWIIVAWGSTYASFWLKIDLYAFGVSKRRCLFCLGWFSLFFLTVLRIRWVYIELVEILSICLFLRLFGLRAILKAVFLALDIATETLGNSLGPLVS